MLINRTSFLNQYPNFSEGMAVYSSNGEKLGKVINLGDDYFTVEKGIFFPKDFTLRYDDISEIRDDTIYLKLNESDLMDWRNDSYTGWEHTEGLNAGRFQAQPLDQYKDRYQDRLSSWSNEQVKVPVVEEELEARKTMKQAGELRLRKIVHTELRHFTVPVMREEVRVERVAVNDAKTGLSPGETAFEEKTINIPVMEEEVTISKRPVVKEEIRVSKERQMEERTVEGEIKKESVEIEGEEGLKRKKAG